MIGIPIALTQLIHLLVITLCGWFLLSAFRWVRDRSAVLGAIFAVAVLARVAIGLALFWISYLELPIAKSLQTRGGFWQLAADAQGYYELAVRALETGTFAVDPSGPSPFFVKTLALWMFAVGVSPAAGMFLNLCLYAALIGFLVWYFAPINNWRRDLPCIVAVAAYSFSPVILIHATQPLKDEFVNALIATACFGVAGLSGLIDGRSARSSLRAVIAGATAVIAATFGIAGTRYYYAVIIWCTLAMVLAIFAARGRRTPLPRYLGVSFLLLVAVWLAFWSGSGPFYGPVGGSIAAAPSQLVKMAQMARKGFLTSGGNTNIVLPLREDAEPGRARSRELEASERATAAYQEWLAQQAAKGLDPQQTQGTPSPPRPGPPSTGLEFRGVPITLKDHLRTAATGLAVVFVPISLLRTVSGIEMSGSQKSLAIADVDTLFLDATSLFVLALLWTRRHTIGDRLPFVVFALILSATAAMLLGYVVTNYGTLWRLRSLVSVPLWLSVFALSPQTESRREISAAGRAAASPGWQHQAVHPREI